MIQPLYTYTIKDHTKHCKAEMYKALAFSGLLIAMLVISLSASIGQADRVILGTEMNTNGQVEYLCLFDGCDDLTAIRWNDKE